MKICILTPRFPFPERGGDVLRINNIARHLKRNGHELLLISFCEKNDKIKDPEGLYDKIVTVPRSWFDSVLYSLIYLLTLRPIQCGYYYSNRFKKTFQKVVREEKPEWFLSHLTRMAVYLEEPNIKEMSTIEMTDALSKTYALSSQTGKFSLKKIIYSIEKHLICRHEKEIIESFPRVELVSQADIDYLKSKYLICGESLRFHSNGIDCPPIFAKEFDANKICFIGNMRSLPNEDAATHFANDVFPLIQKHNPKSTFHIVGNEPSADIMQLKESNPSIFVTGYIDNLREYISDACLVVAPIRIAAGIQNKVLLSMSHGIPVIMSSLISYAIPELSNGVNCIIEDDNLAFAKQCIALMENADLRNNIGARGYEIVKANYSWEKKLEGYI